MSYEVTDGEIAQGRVDLASLLWERCTIKRRDPPVVGTFATLASDVPCRLAPRGAEVAGSLVLSVHDPHGDMTLSLAADQDMEAGDIAYVTSRMIEGARKFEATFVEPRVAFLKRVRGTVEG